MTTVDKTLADLEWPLLLDQLAARCASMHAAERARSLLPADDLDEARLRAARTAEALTLHRAGDPIPASGLVDLGDLLLGLAKGAVATASELHSLRQVLHTAHTLRRYVGAHRDAYPRVSELLATDNTLDKLMDTLDFAIEPDGGLADRASADLATARRRAGEMRQRVISRLEELINRYAEVLQDRYYTVRDGRYVLPIRSDSHIRVPGIVLGSSASGATLFIEPRAVMSLGNQLKVAMADVEREEARVLADLSERASRQVGALETAYEACVAADLLAAIARLGADLRAVAIIPERDPVLELHAIRHPLLALAMDETVPNDLSLAAGKVLVISGPNAGGKTVALKCLGMAVWMARAGLPVPVLEGSRIGWLDPVLSDVGDDQSLARSLSTFSAHVTNLAHILETARPGALVLLDELAGGTDPEEGQALAAAVLDRLASRGAAVAVTTHYELLKTLAVRDDRFVNASVGFDLTTMLPTFAVTMGIPGASSALAVAARYGIPLSVIDRAKELLPEQSVGREDILRRIQDEQIAAQLARRAAESEHAEVERLRREIESERNAQKAREHAKITREGQELLDGLRRAREEIREAESRVKRKKAGEQDVREASKAIDRVAQQVALGGSLSAATTTRRSDREAQVARRPAREDELRPGARVYVARLGITVDVLETTARGQVRVAAGPLKLFIPVREALIDENPRVEEKPSAQRRSNEGASVIQLPVAHAGAGAGNPGAPMMRNESNTCDVRGLRADDALAMVDAFVDRIINEQGDGGFVLHGHGTGALKLAVREHLRSSPFVARAVAADPEDGGDAFTAFRVR